MALLQTAKRVRKSEASGHKREPTRKAKSGWTTPRMTPFHVTASKMRNHRFLSSLGESKSYTNTEKSDMKNVAVSK